LELEDMLYAIASEDEMLGEYAKVFWDYIKDDVIANFKSLARSKRRISKADLLAIFYRLTLDKVNIERQKLKR